MENQRLQEQGSRNGRASSVWYGGLALHGLWAAGIDTEIPVSALIVAVVSA